MQGERLMVGGGGGVEGRTHTRRRRINSNDPRRIFSGAFSITLEKLSLGMRRKYWQHM
jgi:hypothetical protein